MASVKITFVKDVKPLQKYLKAHEGRETPQTEQQCRLDHLRSDFMRMQKVHNSKGNEAIHIIQSFSPSESKSLTPDQVHSMGLELINKFAPGHEFVVQTHTDTPHLHNHIVLNPVHVETGERIQNKKRHLGILRDYNDEIAKARGLSVLPRQEARVSPQLSEKVQRIDRMRGRSYIMDLSNKAHFASSHSTNYDEYVAILNSFDINARIEPKNITYFYPGKEHGKRGRNLTPDLDKPGLESKFESNRIRFQNSPELKKTLVELVGGYLDQPEKVRAQPLVSSRAGGVTTPRPEEIEKSFIPIEELQKAKAKSILVYCERNKVRLVENEEGKKVLRDRTYVEVSDYSWTNHRNKTRGNLIDFVANHRQVNYLKSVSIINDNPRLLLLEQHLGEVKKHFQSFYVPRDNPAPRDEAVGHLARFLNLANKNPVHAELFKRQCVHVNRTGSILLFSEKDTSGYFEYEPELGGTYRRKKVGQFTSPFVNQRSRSGELYIFGDPKTLLQKEPGFFIKAKQNGHGVLALFEPNLALVHQAIVSQPKIRKVQFVSDLKQEDAPAWAAFFNQVKQSLDPFSIDTTLAWMPLQMPKAGISQGQSQDLDPNPFGLELGRSMSLL